MTSQVLSNAELDQLLLNFLARFGSSPYRAALPLFDFLYDFGFRVRELQNIQNWTLSQDGIVECVTSKGSNNRFIQFTELPNLVQRSILENDNLLFLSTYTSYRRYFYDFKGVRRLTVGNKNISTHVFRHNKIKKIRSEGVSKSDIQQLFGLKNLSVVDSYLSSEIIAFRH